MGAIVGATEGPEPPSDLVLPVTGTGVSRGSIEVYGADGELVPGDVVRIGTAAPGLSHWVPDAPLQPGAYHAVAYQQPWLRAELQESDNRRHLTSWYSAMVASLRP